MTKAAESGGAGESKRKLTRGRQKIEMKRIASEEARQVCFSKRRAGLFKKANELAVLCGAHLTVVVFSPAGRPFSFGHPSVHAVLDRFLSASTPPPSTPAAVVPHQTVIQEFDRQMGDLSKALDAARRRKEMLEEVARKAGVWSNADVQGKGLVELEAMRAALERVQAEAAERASAVIAEEAMQCEQREAHGVFAAGGGGHEVLDMGMVVMAGKVGHGAPHGHGHGHALAPLLPFAPLQPPLNPAFNHGFGYNLKVGRGYTLNSGNGLGSTLGVYAKVEGFYGQGTFFG